MPNLPFPYAPYRTVDITTHPRSPTRTAFGEIRVAFPTTVFDSKQVFEEDPLAWNNVQLSGSGTSSAHNPNRSSTTLSVSANTAGVRVRQSRQYVTYQPGKSQAIKITCVPGAQAAGIRRRFGYFDDEDGLFFEQHPTIGYRVARRSFVTGSVVDYHTNRADWNMDRLDGQGPSGYNLDFVKGQIGFIDFQWLALGSVRFGFEFDGQLIYCHQMNHSNLISEVYIRNPNLPVRYELTNDGTGGAATMEAVCCSVVSEGGRDYQGIDRATDRGATAIVVPAAGAFYPVLAIRADPTRPGALIRPSRVSVMSPTSTAFHWRMLLNPTVAGTAFSWNAGTNTRVQTALPTNATTVSGGTILGAGYLDQTNNRGGGSPVFTSPDFYMGYGVKGVASTKPDEVVLAVQLLTGTNESVYGAVSYQED